ncbi:MAG: rhodanese-like domain-containing protein [Actinobacteria bacterium]|nr:rhodanese-like domain-containing protein [Actinomycetota bacterium]
MAWAMLSENPAATLVDVRTEAEWNFVGMPDLRSVGKQVRFVEWLSFPAGEPNEAFLDRAADGLDRGAPVLLLCRSGHRSQAAALLLADAGFTQAVNVEAGFEGDLDGDSHRHGGWKDHLPWVQR